MHIPRAYELQCFAFSRCQGRDAPLPVRALCLRLGLRDFAGTLRLDHALAIEVVALPVVQLDVIVERDELASLGVEGDGTADE